MRIVRRVVSLIALGMLVAVAGCSAPAEPELRPVVAPPAIATAGELAVGVDLELPPFGGSDGGREAGLDVDVAAALAERLGLKVKLVDVKPSDAATALAGGSVDVVLSVPLSDTSLSAVSLAGAYAYDGPALFVSTGSTESVEPSLTVTNLPAGLVGVQQSSPAYWYLLSELDAEALKPYATLREAFDALVAGEVPVVAGDAFVGAYMARDLPGVHFAGQLQPASPLSVAVAADNSELQDVVREALDALAADGVFDTLRRKWVGELPELEGVPSTEESSAP